MRELEQNRMSTASDNSCLKMQERGTMQNLLTLLFKITQRNACAATPFAKIGVNNPVGSALLLFDDAPTNSFRNTHPGARKFLWFCSICGRWVKSFHHR
jgi:hypothetical protein